MTDKEAYSAIWHVVKRYCYECPDDCEKCPITELREWLNAKERKGDNE